jgi:hypothetical protein
MKSFNFLEQNANQMINFLSILSSVSFVGNSLEFFEREAYVGFGVCSALYVWSSQ